jgi:hypothetical protein
MSESDEQNIARKLEGMISDALYKIRLRLRYKLRKRRLRKKLNSLRRAFWRNWEERYKPYVDYFLNEFLWITLANGLILNLVFNYFLGFPLTVRSVVSWGALWYTLSVMTPSLRKQE